MKKATIATHNGSAYSREHNRRNPKITDKEAHIQKDGHYEIWKDEDPRAAYKRLFGEALEEYNEGKRKDRKIKDYYSHIKKDKKKHPVYEMIAGVYTDGLTMEEKREILKEYTEGWKERNPNLELIGAYFHFDEEGKDPHVHLDYIPVYHTEGRGLKTQTGLVKALEEQDPALNEGTHGRKDTAQIRWEKRENEALEALVKSYGVEVEHPGDGREHEKTELYKIKQQVRDQAKELEQTKAELVEARTEALEAVEEAQEAKKAKAKAEADLEALKAETAAQRETIEAQAAQLVRQRQEIQKREKIIQGQRAEAQKLSEWIGKRITLKMIMEFLEIPEVKAAFMKWKNEKAKDWKPQGTARKEKGREDPNR